MKNWGGEHSIFKSKKAKNGSTMMEKLQNEIKLSRDAQKNICDIKSMLGNADDLVINLQEYIRPVSFFGAVIFIQSMVDNERIDNISLEVNRAFETISHSHGKEQPMEVVKVILSGFRKTKCGMDIESACDALLSGCLIILIDGSNEYLAINTQNMQARALDEPTSQSVIRGPKEGFTERINTNIMLLRRRLMTKWLRIEKMSVGQISKTEVAIIYLENIAKPEIVEIVRKKIKQIEIDAVLESSYIEELIRSDKYSVFPVMMNSEKPDSVAAALLEGRVSVIVDGTPYVLIMPCFFYDFFQVSEDFYNSFYISSVISILRYTAFFLSIFVPAANISILSFHHEIIPTPLLISLAAQREGLPFPVLIEVVIMELIFEILREAGIRMPKAIGNAISIVGALVLGQAAVEAGLISAFTIIVLSITAISSFTIPSYAMINTSRFLRFVFIALSGFMGFYGVFIGIIIIVLHLSKLKTLGLPYLSPLSPASNKEATNILLRPPIWSMTWRLPLISKLMTKRINIDKSDDQLAKKYPEFEEKNE